MPQSHLKFHSANGKRRILIIEDESINREILRYMLEEDYELLFAGNGREALSILSAEAETLSLVLADLNLPDMHGMYILEKMKENGRTAMIPSIVMTSDQNAEVDCLGIGATDFITKPYPKQEIVLARIRRTIELFEDRDVISFTERDHLTGLYNPEYFFHYADQFDTFHPDMKTDAIFIDINHFHMLNERYGRDTGDRVLKTVASKLLESVRGTDGIVCRRSGDSFLIYCPHRSDYEEILESACVAITENNRIRVRMGVYPDTDRSIDIEHRFDRAKQASDSVKNNFAASVGIYDHSMYEKELYAEHLLEDFRAAIDGKQFAVHYQPKFNIQGEKPVLSSCEALVRWKHPELGMINPGVFIPLFEDNGLIQELDQYVWKEAAQQIAAWKTSLSRTVPVSVNVSRVDLYDPSLLDTLTSITQEAGISNSELYLEITESAYTNDSERITRAVMGLRRSGFYIEMDDFGTGYSSLNMITTLPIDALKLDRKFILTAFSEKRDTRLIEAVIALAQALNLSTIAEGVETEEQLRGIRQMGCRIAQGFYFSKALPAFEFESYVKGLDA